MSRILLFLILFMVHAWGATSDATATTSWWNESIWENPDRGFLWYPPPKADRPPEDKSEPAKPVDPAKPKTIYEMTTSKDVQEELNRLLDVAIFNPSEKNMYDYLKAKAYVLGKASNFTDIGRRAVWQNGELDYNARIPGATFARFERAANLASKRDTAMVNLAKDYGMLFFFSSECIYCKTMANVLNEIKRRHSMELLGVSVDGGGIEGLSNWRPDNGISMMVTRGEGIQTVPALYLVARSNKEIIPIGVGSMAVEEVLDRIYTLTQTKPGDNF